MNDREYWPPKLAAAIRKLEDKYGKTPNVQGLTPQTEMLEDLQREEQREFAIWYRRHLAENGWTNEVRESLVVESDFDGALSFLKELPTLCSYIGSWRPQSNYVIGGQPAAGGSALKITLADAFSRAGGRLLWIGSQDELRLITMKLLLREARIEHSESFNVIQVTEAEKAEAFRAHERMCERSIILFDIVDVGNSEAESELLALLSANQPTWVIVEPSSYEEGDLTKLEASERRCAINRFLDQVQETSPASSGLWQVNLPGRNDGQYACRPTLDDGMSPVRTANTEVVIFVHREHANSFDLALRNQAELIVAKNDFGPTGAIPMSYMPELSTWQEEIAVHEAGYHFELGLRDTNAQRNNNPT